MMTLILGKKFRHSTLIVPRSSLIRACSFAIAPAISLCINSFRARGSEEIFLLLLYFA